MPGPKSDKIWADAVHKAVKRYHEEITPEGKVKKERYLNLLADNLVKAGMAMDMTAIKEIGDRLDGKPHATSEVQLNSTQEFLKALRLLNGDSDRYSEGMEEAGGEPADLRNASPEGHA